MIRSVEELETHLDRIREEHDRLLKVLTARGIEKHYSKEARKVIDKNFPLLGAACKKLIEHAGVFTERDGHSRRLDYIKNVLYGVYGKCLGVDLSENLSAE